VACRRNRVDERVGIDYLKRYATDIDIEDPWTPTPAPANGKKVAVVGGGPAGLTCAYYLVLKGYAVTLFEKSPHLGGMLRYGIPEYRLPKEMLDKEISWITNLGVTVKTNSALGKDLSIAGLKEQGFDAIYLAFGAQKAKSMRLPDEETIAGVLPGIDFLWQLQSAEKPKIHGNVVVVGGGNTALDAARTAKRLGAAKVTILYRRTRNEMPAHPMEIEAAIEEGVDLVLLSAPT
jgi:formate dehydrogenase major subunit